LPPKETLLEVDLVAKKRLPHVELYAGVIDLLQYLRKSGKKVALVTSSFHENIVHLLERYEMLQYFDAIIASDDIIHHKPHPEPIEKALASMAGTKQQAVIIGDSDKDLDAATNAGIDSILYHEPSHEKFYPLAELAKLRPTHVVSRLEEIKSDHLLKRVISNGVPPKRKLPIWTNVILEVHTPIEDGAGSVGATDGDNSRPPL
jgi:HAD superfamily hydrolase (TIGR01509 family)